MYEHQDHEVVVFHGTGNEAVQTKKIITDKRTTNQPSAKLFNNDNDDHKIKTYTKTVRQNVVALRASLKLTRVQFAQRLSVKEADIRDMENGGAHDGRLIDKINRVFKVNLQQEK
jgi:ribosome-binding protein aMBF1 (putative translation factor)